MDNQNIWDESASIYSELSPKISFYDQTSSFLFNFFDIKECRSIVDLGCGSSGLVATKALLQNPLLEKVYCIDSSFEMVQECSRVVKSPKAVFIQSGAENFDKAIDGKVDLVIINSAFWLFNTNECLESIFKALNNSGSIIFNLAEWDFDFSNHKPHPKYESIDRQLKMRNIEVKKSRGSQKKFSKEEIEKQLAKEGFSISKIESLEIEVAAKDWLNFYAIPTIVKRSLPTLSLEVGKDILKSAILDLSESEFPSVRWIFFKAEKMTTIK